MQLNQAQTDAVQYVSGPCLVLAGAGSGKTRVIITKICYLLRHNLVTPSQVLAVTFTNKAALEMRERIAKEVDEDTAAALTITTFHSLGRLILKEQAARLKMGRNFSIFDQSDSFKIMKQIITSDFPNLKDGTSYSFIEGICQQISRWKGDLKSPSVVVNEGLGTEISQELYRKYTEYLRACNAVDFDDLIYLPTKLLLLDEEVRQYYQQRFRYCLVDEYQDTNGTQYYLFMCLVDGSQNFTVVGDDDQSIYSWRGARPDNIKRLGEDYPSLKVIKLEQNYRSSARILRCANSIIAHNPHLYEKTLFSGHAEGPKIKVYLCPNNEDACDFVAGDILGHQFDYKYSWNHYAILYRSNSQARDLEKALMSAHIPSKITGDTSFFEKMEVKDIMAWCRLLINPKDDASLLRVINIPPRGIGATTIKALTDLSHRYQRCLYDCACSEELQQQLNKAQSNALLSFLGLLVRLRNQLLQGQDQQLCQTLLEQLGYVNYLKAESGSNAWEWKLKNVETLTGWIEELISGKKGERCTFSDAIDRLGLREMMDKQPEEEVNAVQMMTLHAAKGLEFPFVYLVGMEEGVLPHHVSVEENNIEEERRLAYVGVTRAQRELKMVASLERKQGNNVVHQELSRFIAEMPEADYEIIDRSDKNHETAEDKQHNMGRLLTAIINHRQGHDSI